MSETDRIPGGDGECRRLLVLHDGRVLADLQLFLERFEAVFGEADWWATIGNLADGAKGLIAENGTFLEPGVEDESNNWGNRGALLDAYRRLRHTLDTAKFDLVRKCHRPDPGTI